MNEDSTFGFKGFAILFAFLVIGFAGAQSQPGGQFDLLTKVVRKPVKVATATTTTTTTTTSTATAPTTSTTTTAATTGTSNSVYSESTAVPSGFDANSLLLPTSIPSSAAPDVVGAFRFICSAGQLLRDDPVVYPGQPGKSHLHQFYGNLAANANSTYASLRQNGGSSCEGGNGTTTAVNRSAYWMPAMLDGIGNVVRPDFISIYYKRRPISDPKCSLTSGDPKAEGNCVPLPNGLRFVFGYDMLTGQAPTGSLYFTCQGPSSTATASYPNMVEAIARCPATPTAVRQADGSFKNEYNRLGAVINAPSCWDGKNLDSPNHRDHVAYGGYGWWGYFKCPPTHPYVIPGFTLGAWFRVDENLGTWRLSSDDMMPGTVPGTTFHADWFGAWDNQVQAMWTDNCINKLLNCSAGNLGNGKIINGMGGSFTANPRLVRVPA